MRRAAGFSLIEILMAILIAAIVAAIAIPVFNGQRDRAKDHAAQQDLEVGYRTLRHIGDDEVLPVSGLAARLAAAEPTRTFFDGTSFAGGQVSVERVSTTRAILRTKSRSGAEMLLAADKDTGATVRVRSTPSANLQPLTNLIPNPSGETNTSGWAINLGNGQTGTVTRSTAWAAAGSYAMLFDMQSAAAAGTAHDLFAATASMPVTANKTYTCQARVDVIADAGAGAACWLWFANGSGGSVGGGVRAYPGTGVKTVSFTMQAPPTAVSVRSAVGWWSCGSGFNAQMYVDAVSVVASDRVLSYFDGDTPGASWTGTAHNSASTGYPDGSVLG